jgi:hypothetical protein
MPTTVVTTSKTLDLTDDVLLVDSTAEAVTLSLPSPHPTGKRYIVKHVSGSNPVEATAIAGVVDGLPSFPLTTPKQAAVFHGDGTNWHIL